MRVAVSQFATSSNTQNNLASCIRIINEAATCQPSLIVLPHYCNTLFSNTPIGHTQPCYADHDQAWDEAVAIDGPFLQAIAEQAIKHDCFIVINVTLRRNVQDSLARSNHKSNISVTSCLYSPLGKLIHQEDKQTLSALESKFFISAGKVPEVITTPVGKLGLLIGSDSMTFEAARVLALGGAQLLCNSINSFALDQSHLHNAARAFENNVFLATANKVGALIPLDLTHEQPQDLLASTDVGSGQSQIVSPDGKVLAQLNNHEEGFVYADIDLSETDSMTEVGKKCGLNNKFRPDGTPLITQLRPQLYQALTAVIKKTKRINEVSLQSSANQVPVTANVAIFATYKSNEQAIEDVCQYIENNLSDIIQLPELFFIADKTIINDSAQRADIAKLSQQLIEQVSAVLRPFQYLCTSLVIEGKHQAVLINKEGLLATQQQLHFCQRYQWTELGNELNIIELPLEQGKISLAMLTADDANIPEIVKVAALAGIHLLLVPFDIQEPCEVDYSLLSRAAENRICIVAASREKNFANELPTEPITHNIYGKNKVKVQKSTGLIANLTTQADLLPQWRKQKFNGYINQPLVKLQYGKITKAVIHPIAACTKRAD
ncbi:nitrilase-related carbon-nitrogen hydrolase [Colwellia sp. 12G3]|uniref:nitrilase-related carbon-nitrogen hydrolase n=1 Tax=Colwellia sp. 12G3 TaxID=2058299 RepID=UPI000C3333F3|nr:nitrilase-related carbon-nitrogen hydrolase [Colwellia sp. 12G3]PKI16252.1 carbon-nitrogen hydrolase [Colwellia sp. 12G3]